MSALTRWERVDQALDRYVTDRRKRGGIAPEGVRAVTLARYAKVTAKQMSDWLLDHRRAQATGRTRYVIAATGYGVAARWSILSMPGSDPVSVQERRVKHAAWISADHTARFFRDRLLEVHPGLKGAAKDPTIKAALDLAAAQMVAISQYVGSVLVSQQQQTP